MSTSHVPMFHSRTLLVDGSSITVSFLFCVGVPDCRTRQAVAHRVKNFLEKESGKPDFPIKVQVLDVRNMDYDPRRRNRRLELCVSLKVR